MAEISPVSSSDEVTAPTEAEEQGQTQVVGVRFQRAGRIYYFDPAGVEVDVNDPVVAETVRGLELGWVAIAPKQVMASQIKEPLKPILRKASPEESSQKQELRSGESEVLVKCQEKVTQFNLPMKLIAAEYNLDRSRLTVYFSAEGRVDFRDLVRALAATVRARVELRQVGDRDEAKLLGGVGRCGRPLCCATHLTEFNSVSIKMAKEQDLPLNPTRISGVCGRFLCCLAFENEIYHQMKGKLPAIGQNVLTSSGQGRVLSVNILKEAAKIELEGQAIVELPLKELEYKPEPASKSKRRRGQKRKKTSN